MRKKRSRYGDYTEILHGQLYASVNIPIGNGKYRKKRKKVSTKTEARDWALDQLNRSKHGETIGTKTSFFQLAEWYAREFLIAPVYKQGRRVLGIRTYQRQKTMLDRLERTFGTYHLDAITVDTLRRYKRERLKTSGIAAVNRDFALMRTMFKKARARKWMIENPFDLGEQLIEIALEPHRESPLTERIAKRLLARSRKSESPLLHYLTLVMMHTGGRPSEIYPYEAKEHDEIERDPLSWDKILEFKFQAVRLVSYKGRIKRERVVPASEELERGLRKFYAETNPKPTDLLFPQTSFKTSWNTLCKSIGVKGVRLRDFRHYYNTYLINRGFDDIIRMLILGHLETKTNLRYSLIDAEFIKKYRTAVSK